MLDIGLPGMSGAEVCSAIRAFSRVPIVMLTARDTDLDKVALLEAGADDYVVKPFSPPELVARVRAVLRRTSSDLADGSGALPGRPPASLVSVGGLALDPEAREVTVDGVPVALTAREFDLLLAMARRPGVVFSREQLLEAARRLLGLLGGARRRRARAAPAREARRRRCRPAVHRDRARGGLPREAGRDVSAESAGDPRSDTTRRSVATRARLYLVGAAHARAHGGVRRVRGRVGPVLDPTAHRRPRPAGDRAGQGQAVAGAAGGSAENTATAGPSGRLLRVEAGLIGAGLFVTDAERSRAARND